MTSFETAQTIECKMANAKSLLTRLLPHNTHRLVWLAHDLTFNLGQPNCGGDVFRLRKMRSLA